MTSERTGLLMDWGGVMTTNVFDSFAAFCVAEDLDTETVKNAFAKDPVARELLSEFECGRLSDEEFEVRFGGVLGVREPIGLIARLFGNMGMDDAMLSAVAGWKTAGIRTGLLSNSWGTNTYDRRRFDELFDVLVVSGEHGVRKPQPEIYDLAVEAMALPPQQLVFVDDLPGNLKPARALGIHTIVHRSAKETIAELREVFGS